MTKKRDFIPLMLVAATAAALGLGAALAQADKPKADPMQFARGAKAWAKNCARCHNMRSAQDNSDEEWHVDVTHMRIRANIPGDVARDIKAFLQASNN